MSNVNEIFTSVIGKQLVGKSKFPPRTETHAGKDKLLGDLNKDHCILKESAECTILIECLKEQEFSDIKLKLVANGIKLLEKEKEIIIGNRILCEYNEMKIVKHSKRNECILKGKYVLGTTSKRMLPPKQIYKTEDRIIPNSNWNSRIVLNDKIFSSA